MNDIKLALLGNKEAAKRLTDAGVLIPCPWCNGDRKETNNSAVGYWVFCFDCDADGQLPPTNTKPASPGTPAHRF